jgi:predicted transcriptional regulator
MAGLSVRLPEELEVKLGEEARREGVPRSEVARTAIAEFLERKERERYIAAFVAEARAAYTDPKIREEAVALAEEALPFDNDGLRVAEARGRYSKAANGRRKTKRR